MYDARKKAEQVAGKPRRANEVGQHRTAFEKNRKRIYATQTVCALCGRPVDFTLKYPHPMSATIDHIIPIARGGHPSDMDNLQLAHLTCNRQKADKLRDIKIILADTTVSNRDLPWSTDWASYQPTDE